MCYLHRTYDVLPTARRCCLALVLLQEQHEDQHYRAHSAHAADKTVTLDVPGMFCVLCQMPVKKALQKVDGRRRRLS